MIIIIGVALLAFIIGDLTNVINFGRNTVMQVDKNKIEAGPNENTYSEYYQQNYEYNKYIYTTRENKDNPLMADNSAVLDQTTHELTYQQILRETILDKQLKKIGLAFTDEMKMEISENVLKSPEMRDIFFYAAREFTESLQDRNMANLYWNYLAQAMQSTEAMESLNKDLTLYKLYKALERQTIIEAKENTYFGLAVNSIHFSKKLLAQMANENNRFNGQMVAIDFNNSKFDNIDVEVSDKEAKAYFKEHKNRYTLRETVKDVDIAYFPVEPTLEDDRVSADLANSLFQRLQDSESLKEFLSQSEKLDKMDLKYTPNTKDPYTYDMLGGTVVAPYTQIDTTLYLKDNETALQKRNLLCLDSSKQVCIYPRQYSSHAKKMPDEMTAMLSQDSSSFIQPKKWDNAYYFGQVRDVQPRPDSIQVVELMLHYTDNPSDKNKQMTEEQAHAKALEIQNALVGKDTSSMRRVVRELVTTGDTILNTYYRLDGVPCPYANNSSATNDTLSANWYKELMDLKVNESYIRKIDEFNLFTVGMVAHKSDSVTKRQYVLYPVPVMAGAATDRNLRQIADQVANNETVEDMVKAAKKKGGYTFSTEIRSMQYLIADNSNFIECRDAINWAFSNNKNANNEVGKVAQGAFVGHLITREDAGKTTVREALVVIGITASTEVQDPSFKEMKERVIRDMKAEKKRELVVERLKKEFNGNNMAEIASKYGKEVQTMAVAFSEYGAMESAAVGKIAGLSAGKNTVVSGNNFAYLVSVTSVDKADMKQEIEKNTNEIKAIYQQQNQPINDATARKQAEQYIMNQYLKLAYRTTLAEYPQKDLVEIVKDLVYNDIADDIKLVDHRSRFYGASESR